MQPSSPIPLNLEEHRELGMELRAARARLHELCRLVEGVYGPNNRAAFSFLRVVEAMDRLCGDMQTQAGRDLPGYSIDGFYT